MISFALESHTILDDTFFGPKGKESSRMLDECVFHFQWLIFCPRAQFFQGRVELMKRSILSHPFWYWRSQKRKLTWSEFRSLFTLLKVKTKEEKDRNGTRRRDGTLKAKGGDIFFRYLEPRYLSTPFLILLFCLLPSSHLFPESGTERDRVWTWASFLLVFDCSAFSAKCVGQECYKFPWNR